MDVKNGIDYNVVEEKLKKLRAESAKYLKDALKEN